MRTTATNRKLRLLITAIRDEKLIPDPEFQRRLVWTNKEKINFLETVLGGYPFPEIYIAAGDVDPDTGEGTEMLVDGQQRITTLYLYFIGSREIKLGKIKPYAELSPEEKRDFLEYEVVVRDLGQMSILEIKKIFEKINATSYSLNAMEVHNARYDGEFKKFAEDLSFHPFFDNHKIFSAGEIKRMRDISYILTFVITIMSTYFNREDELENFLQEYNDEFDHKEELRSEIHKTLEFIDGCDFDATSRVWKKTDLFTLIVELHRKLFKEKQPLRPNDVKDRLKHFYSQVDYFAKNNKFEEGINNLALALSIEKYYKAALSATNDRGSRILRGEIIHAIMTRGLVELAEIHGIDGF